MGDTTSVLARQKEGQLQPQQRGQTQKIDQILVWWNCAGGLSSKLNFVKSFVNENDPFVFFVSEANIKTNTNYNFLNIKGYELITSESNFSRVACYFKAEPGVRVVSRGSGS